MRDFLGHVLKDLNTEKFLAEEFILLLVFTLLIGMSETIYMTLTLVFKFLSENPHVLEELEVSFNSHIWVSM